MSDWTTSLEGLIGHISVGPEASDTDLVTGADCVEGCIERAVTGELDPTGNLALGRYPPFLSPGAGAWLAKKGRYDAQNPESRAVLGRAVRRTLGVGWLLAATGGFDVAECRDERSVYAIWAPSFADPIVNVSDKETQRTVHQAGSNIFSADLREAGMTKLLGGSKLNQVGSVIAGGGFLLRLTQSTMMDDTEFTEAAARWSALITSDSLGRGRWAWENYTA